MIEIYKLRELKSKDLESYTHINPWWYKKINKLVFKLKKFITHFNVNPNDYLDFNMIQEVSLDKFFRSTNNYLHFLNPKLNHILTNKKLLAKFQNQIRNYMKLVGMNFAILTMIDFYNQLNDDEILNKKELVLNIANKTLNDKFQRFTIEVLKLIPNEYKSNLKDLYSENIKNELFNSSEFVRWTNKYVTKLFKTKKLKELDFLKIIYFCILENEFNRSFNLLIKEFINRL
ncbi:hypothetical protein [Mycoplasma feriruminatoris]|uniref:hypothetical protein n=1 Tax=Mycoplasma feriruminatoris TaxID=1179777 RepID=UPI00241E4778|nr:hypothetical protein [Mycoplasma feriruminatoris]WFQ90350.1 hypothetical protein MFERI11561_00604 [Mycoplasma feriruminatoris]